MHEIVDVAVVGAGPAGAAAALRLLQLRPDARVLMLDAATFPRDKTCGDGIAAHVLDLLAALGMPDLSHLGPAVSRMQLRSPGGRVVSRTWGAAPECLRRRGRSGTRPGHRDGACACACRRELCDARTVNAPARHICVTRRGQTVNPP